VGTTLYELGDLAGADRYLRESVHEDPVNASAWTHLAKVRMEEGDHSEAEECIVRALERGRGYETLVQFALNALEVIEARSGSTEEFAGVLRRCHEFLAGSPNFWVTVARVQQRLGSQAQAAESLEAALRLSPEHPAARRFKEEWSSPSAR
jgi:cytochrome c-type biogenesis protein CcmH/NrfG